MKLRSRDLEHPSTRYSVRRRSLRLKSKMYGYNVHGQNGQQVEVVKGVRADWDPITTNIFCRWAAQAIDQRMVQGSHLTKAGWNFILDGFRNETALPYTRTMLKNKWRLLRKQYTKAKTLLGSMTGLGWDYAHGTVMADEYWWAVRIQQCPDAATLRGKQLPNILDMERMFTPVRDLPGFGWSPQMGRNLHTPNINGAAIEEFSDDVGDTSTQDGIPAAPCVLMQGGSGPHGRGMCPSLPAPFAAQQYGTGPSHVRPTFPMASPDTAGSRTSGRRKCKSGDEELTAILSKIIDYLTTGRKEQMIQLAGAITDPNDMGLVMRAVEALPGVTEGDPFWMEAADFFMENEKAIGCFMRGCGSVEVQLQWLQHQIKKRRGS